MSIWICDVNGVLIDSTAVVRSAFAATASRYRFAFDDRAFQRIKGLPLIEAYRLLDPGAEAARRREFHVRHVRERAAEIRAYPGVAATLAAARGSGIRLAATTTHGETAECGLVNSGIYACFDCLVTQDEVRRPKPDPGAILLVLRLMARDEAAPRREWIAHIGDTVADVEAARAAGLATVGVTYGVSSTAEMRSARPDHLVDAFGDMCAFLPAGDRRHAARHAVA